MLPTAVVTFAGIDETCLVEVATIRHGRDDPNAQPEADALTATLLGALPAAVDIGSTVTLSAILNGTTYPRFVGRVTDLTVGWDDPDLPRPHLVAVGPLSDMGRRVVGDTPWPIEADGARANRVIGLAGVPTDAARTDPGTLQVLARDVDAQPALSVAQDAALDGMGILWTTKDGKVVYADADHRRGAQVELTLDSCAMPLSVGWQKSLAGLCNDVRVYYGLPPDGGTEQPHVRQTDAPSIADRGVFGASIATRILNAADANLRAGYVMARQANPAWVLSGVSIYLELIGKLDAAVDDAALSAAVLGLEMHDLVKVSALPAGSPYSSTVLWVEGWLETISWDSWQVSLAVSDYCRTSAEPRWDDVDPLWSWDTVDPALSWDDTSCLPPVPSQGFWDDTPSTTRWDLVDAAITWDTWS